MTKARDLADFIASGTIAQTVTADGVSLGDDDIANFGAGNDLQILHNSANNNSIIRELGSGVFSIQTNGSQITFYDSVNVAQMGSFNTGGSVDLSFAGTTKFSTTSTGVDVTGTVVSDGLTVSGNVGIGTSSPATNLTVESATSNGSGGDNEGMIQAYYTGTSNGNASLISKNYYGIMQFMAWESNGLRIGSRAVANGGSGEVVFTAGNDSEKFRIGSSGELGIGGANYGTSGQVLTSGGSSAAPTWTTINTSFTTNVITTNTTATKDNHYYLNAASITLTLPASPSVGDEVRFSEVAGNTNCIIGRNGSNIMGDAADLTVDTAYLVLYLRYVDATIGWAFS